MEIIKTIIFSENHHEGLRIKSSLEVLPDTLSLDYKFDCSLFETSDSLLLHLKENLANLLIVNHDAEKSNILSLISVLDSQKHKTYKKINVPKSIIVIGPNNARLALECINNPDISGYIIKEDINYKELGKNIISMICESNEISLEGNSTSKNDEINKLYEIISFQEKIFDELMDNYIKLAEQKQKTILSKDTSFYKENEKYNMWLMDIRIEANKEFKDIFLRYESDRILEILIQYIYGYVDKYLSVKLYTGKHRILLGFKGEDVLNCGLEIIIKLAQIHILGESVINNFSIKIGIDKSKIIFHEDAEKILKNTGVEHLSVMLDKASWNNTLYITDKVFANLDFKYREHFYLYQKGGDTKLYSFRQKFGYGL